MDLNWNRNNLSGPSNRVDTEFITKTADKPWDWERLSIENVHELVVALPDKNWDWVELSSSSWLVLTKEVFEKTQDKPRDYHSLGNNDTVTRDLFWSIPSAISAEMDEGELLRNGV